MSSSATTSSLSAERSSASGKAREIQVSRNSRYYLDSVTFKVEDQLFKVPQYRFVNGSDVFRTMFSLPQPSSDSEKDAFPVHSHGSSSLEGGSDENPILLEGISRVDFERFLEVLYPLETPPSPHRSLQTWTSVLHLSTMWSFPALRQHCKSHMHPLVSSLPPVPKIALARRCHVRDWLLEGYDELVRRKSTITVDESLEIGHVASVRLFQERERCRATGHEGMYGNGSTTFGLVGGHGHGIGGLGGGGASGFGTPQFGRTSAMGSSGQGFGMGAGAGGRHSESWAEAFGPSSSSRNRGVAGSTSSASNAGARDTYFSCSHVTTLRAAFEAELNDMEEEDRVDDLLKNLDIGGEASRAGSSADEIGTFRIGRSLIIPEGML